MAAIAKDRGGVGIGGLDVMPLLGTIARDLLVGIGAGVPLLGIGAV